MMFTFATMTACGGDDEEPGLPALDPEVTGFSPVTVVEGEMVTIIGTDFPTDPSAINVTFFDGVSATVVSATSTEIVVTVPAGAENGPITVSIDGEDISTTVDADVRLDIPRDGLVAFYPFTGNANDESDNSNDGTVNGATLTADRHGNANSAYSFDGTDDFIEVADDTTLDIVGNITMSAWVNLSEINSSSIISKIRYNENIQGFEGYEIGTNGSSSDYTFFLNGGFIESGSSSNQTGTWKHLVMVYDVDMLKIYVDNVLIDEKFYDGGISANDFAMYIGNDPVQVPTNGLIDDVAIYNKALSANEVSDLYNQTLTK